MPPPQPNNYDPPAGYQDDGSGVNGMDMLDICEDPRDILINKAVSQATKNLTDDQLIGLLENESLLESFRIECEKFSDDDHDDEADVLDHPLYSNQGYLCGDAISDSDQEESSGLSDATRVGASHSLLSNANTNTREYGRQLSQVATNPTSARSMPFMDIEKSRPMSHHRASSNQRSLPARVKVSTVDGSRTKSTLPTEQSAVKATTSSSSVVVSSAYTTNITNTTTSKLVTNTNKQSTIATSTTNGNANLGNDSPSSSIRRTNVPKSSLIDGTDQSIVRKEQKQETLSFAHKSTTKDQHHHHHQNSIPQRLPSNNNFNNQTAQAQKLPSALPTSLIKTAPQPIPLATSSAPSTTITQQQSIPSQPACHVCRAIESNRGQTGDMISVTTKPQQQQIMVHQNHNPIHSHNPPSQNHSHQHSNPQHVQNQMPTPHQSANNPAQMGQYLDPSCASCRESVSHSTITTNSTNTMLSNNTTVVHVNAADQMPVVGVRPHGAISTTNRPVAAYQIVYVVDQNGNRVRALSLVRPPNGVNIRAMNQALAPGSRAVLAPQPQNGLRFANPNAVIRMPQQQHQVSLQQQLGPQVARHILPARQINHQGQPVRIITASGPQPGGAPVRYIVANQQQLTSMVNMGSLSKNSNVPGGEHTVYFVRQPLAPLYIRGQNLNGNPNTKSAFPGPQEIRRLDGIRAPASGVRPSLAELQQEMNHSRGDGGGGEDPSFGFSNRPSVKVVTASQTLDRRNMTSTRDPLPSTNSMSNIQGVLSRNTTNTTTSSTLNRSTSHQNQDQSSSKGMLISKSRQMKRWLVCRLTKISPPPPSSIN